TAPPPKLSPPARMKILNSVSRLGCRSGSFLVLESGASVSVDEGGLGCSTMHPVCAPRLQGRVEELGKLALLAPHRFGTIELQLVAELRHDRRVGRALPPYRQRRLRLELVAEVQHPEIDLVFLDRYAVDYAQRRLRIRVDLLERRKCFRGRFESLRQYDVGCVELAVVRIDQPHPQRAILGQEDFLLELQRVRAGQQWAWIYRQRRF